MFNIVHDIHPVVGPQYRRTMKGQQANHPGEDLGPEIRIARADNGFEEKLPQLINTGEQPLVWSIDERMHLVKRRLTNRISINRREANVLKLASGRQLAVSAPTAFASSTSGTRRLDYRRGVVSLWCGGWANLGRPRERTIRKSSCWRT